MENEAITETRTEIDLRIMRNSIGDLADEYFAKYSAKSPAKSELVTYAGIFSVLNTLFEGNFKDKTILEIGSDYGFFLYALKQMGADVYAVDTNERIDRNILESNGIRFSGKELITAKDELKPVHIFPDADFDKYDVLISKGVMNHSHISCRNFPMLMYGDTTSLMSKIKTLSDFHVHSTDLDIFSNKDYVKELGYHRPFFKESCFQKISLLTPK